MNSFGEHMAIKLACNHEICMDCISRRNFQETYGQIACSLCNQRQQIQDIDTLNTLIKIYNSKGQRKLPTLICKSHNEHSIFYNSQKKEFLCKICFQEQKPDPIFLKPGAKEDVVAVLLDLKKAYNGRVEFLAQEIQKVEDLIAANKFNNDSLLQYLYKVLESSKLNLLDDTSIQTLSGFLEQTMLSKITSPSSTNNSTNKLIENSSIIKLQSQLDQINNLLSQLNKFQEAKLIYKGSRDGFSSETFWKKCQNFNETLSLLKTDYDTVIGVYSPDQFVDTTGKVSSNGTSDWKDIENGFPFLVCFVNNQIQILNHVTEKTPTFQSDKNYLMWFYGGLKIDADRKKQSLAGAHKECFEWPQNISGLKKNEIRLFLAGGNDHNFQLVDIEVWGLR